MAALPVGTVPAVSRQLAASRPNGELMSDIDPAGTDLHRDLEDVAAGDAPGTGDLADLGPEGGADTPQDAAPDEA